VKRLLLNCDQVFEVLTRGPFPTGLEGDESVEHHLRACHDCRRLAEALRPAVELLHEAFSAEEAIDLPEYQGSLPARPLRDVSSAKARPLTRGMRRLATQSNPKRPHIRQYERLVNAIRLIAASVLVAAIGILLYGVALSPSLVRQAPQFRGSFVSPPLATRMPDQEGLLTLVSFRLPPACLPATHRPASTDEAATLLAAMSDGSQGLLRCCTDCHHAGQAPVASDRLIATVQQNCHLCHRG
jgi:hypothetical protein